MKYANLAQVSDYYAVAASAALEWKVLEHPGVERFATAVFDLSRLARGLDDDTGWREFLYPARRARNIITTVPLPFSHQQLGVSPLLDQLEKYLGALRVYGGDDVGALGKTIVDCGRELLALDDAPLLDAVLDIVESGEQVTTGLLLPMAEHTGVVKQHLQSKLEAHDLAVLSRYDVADLKPLGRMVIVGPMYWYDDHQYVFTSPRAPRIVALKWAWYRDRQPRMSELEGSRGGVAVHVRPAPAPRNPSAISADDERTKIDWTAVSRELSEAGDGDTWEAVLARAAVLAGQTAVLLPEAGDRTVWLLDPHAPAEQRVVRVDVADLEPGHVIVLRTRGGGDLIVPVADEILGAEAPRLRELQARWKAALAAWVLRHRSVTRAAAELRTLGCSHASPQNVKNWLGERSLRTEDRNDWQVLMEAASLGREAETLWRAMGTLQSAHSKAGMSIGKRLRKMASTAPLDTLLTSGVQNFALARSGSVTAFRIDGYSPAVVECAPNHLMVPTKVRDEWLG